MWLLQQRSDVSVRHSVFVVKGIVVFVWFFSSRAPSTQWMGSTSPLWTLQQWTQCQHRQHYPQVQDIRLLNTCQTFKSNSCHLMCWDIILRGCLCYILKGGTSSSCGWECNRRTVGEMCQICQCSVLRWHLKLCFSCNWKHVLVWQYHHQRW